MSLRMREYRDQVQLKEDIESFFYGTLVDPIYSWSYIDENLKSHDYNKLIKTLENEFDPKDIAVYDNGDKANAIYILFKEDVDSTDDKLKTILDFFNYTYRNKVNNKRSQLYGYVCIEPKYSEKISKEEFNKYHGIFYLFCRV